MSELSGSSDAPDPPPPPDPPETLDEHEADEPQENDEDLEDFDPDQTPDDVPTAAFEAAHEAGQDLPPDATALPDAAQAEIEARGVRGILNSLGDKLGRAQDRAVSLLEDLKSDAYIKGEAVADWLENTAKKIVPARAADTVEDVAEGARNAVVNEIGMAQAAIEDPKEMLKEAAPDLPAALVEFTKLPEKFEDAIGAEGLPDVARSVADTVEVFDGPKNTILHLKTWAIKNVMEWFGRGGEQK